MTSRLAALSLALPLAALSACGQRVSDAEPALHEAAEKGDARAVEALLAKGAAVDERCGDGSTALMHAAAKGRFEAVKALLAHGADAKASSGNGMSVLDFSVDSDSPETAEAVLKAGADPNAKDKEGWTALMEVCVDMESKRTPAQMKAWKDRGVRMTQLLLAAKADPNALTTGGKTPLAMAKSGGCDEAVKLLIAAGAR